MKSEVLIHSEMGDLPMTIVGCWQRKAKLETLIEFETVISGRLEIFSVWFVKYYV